MRPLNEFDTADVDTALGYFWRSYKLFADDVEDISYSFMVKIYLSEDQASPVSNNAILDNISSYSNPFNPITDIRFSLAREREVKLTNFNILGQQVRTLIDGSMPAGPHSVRWDGTDESGNHVASSICLHKVMTGDMVESRKITLMK